MDLKNLRAIADGIVALLTPHAEVVVHDIKRGKIAYIANSSSGRSVGDPSLNGPELEYSIKTENIIGPYEKAGTRGQRITSITSVIRDKADNPIFMMCTNLDFSALETAMDTLDFFIRSKTTTTRPESLFQRDWREAITLELRAFLLQTGINYDQITARHRLEFISRLKSRGLFAAKKSADYIAHTLNVSRATIYNDLAKLNDKIKG